MTKDTASYLEIMFINGFIPLINRPTRVTDKSATLIDHIFSNNYINNLSLYQGVMVTDITDHYPVFHITHSLENLTAPEEYYMTRKMNVKNYDKFKKAVSLFDWSNVMNDNSCKNAFTLFYAFPRVKIKRKCNNKLSWLTEALKLSIQNKNKLYIKTKQHDTAYNKMEYITYKIMLHKLMKLQEKTYYSNLINLYKNNLRKTRDTIKMMINKSKKKLTVSQFYVDGSLTEENKIIADRFNHYFAHVGSELANKIPNASTTFSKFCKGNFAQSMFLKPVTSYEIRAIILPLRSCAPGLDNISASVLKYVIDDIIHPLTHICTLSLSQGYFPDELKIAKIVPLYKCKDPSQFNNYRPISLLSIFSKILEKIMYSRL